MHLIFIRHGETKTNVKELMHKTDDSDGLTAKGKTQILATVPILKKNNIGLILSSTENRAIESAKLLSQALDLQSKQLDNLQERNWGNWENKTWPEIQKN